MRVCPSCGHEDVECWRNVRWCLFEQYCHIEELESLDYELFKKINAKWPTEALPLEIPPFIYIITKSRHVKRLALKDYLLYGFHGRETESWRRANKLANEKKQQRIPSYAVAVPPIKRSEKDA